jgi:hypothetical protein
VFHPAIAALVARALRAGDFVLTKMTVLTAVA